MRASDTADTFAAVGTIRVPTERQGQTGKGQGGFTCQRFAEAIGEPVTISLRSPIPLDTDLEIEVQDDRWVLHDPAVPDVAILEASRWEPNHPACDPVSIAEAQHARRAFPLDFATHPAPHCFSCGLDERSLGVHAGPLGDGRWATPLRIPEWSLIGGTVDPSLVWMALDCGSGWYVSHSGPEQRPRAVTVQFAVDVFMPVQPETDYALVAWHGDHQPGWDGRKRGAAATLFDHEGNTVASARSFWISLT